jgi:hypothetical protein
MVEIGGRDTTSYAGCRHWFKREVRLDSLAGTPKLMERTASKSRKRFVRLRPTTATAGGTLPSSQVAARHRGMHLLFDRETA